MVHHDLPLTVPGVPVGEGAAQADLVDDPGELVGVEEAEFLAEFELLLVGDIFGVVLEDIGGAFVLSLLFGEFLIGERVLMGMTMFMSGK